MSSELSTNHTLSESVGGVSGVSKDGKSDWQGNGSVINYSSDNLLQINSFNFFSKVKWNIRNIRDGNQKLSDMRICGKKSHTGFAVNLFAALSRVVEAFFEYQDGVLPTLLPDKAP
jgi:hypothetical protein